MALPRLNEEPRYEMTIPSTGQTVMYRPFLVKEQKILLMALESQDRKNIMTSILDTITTCVPDVDVKKLATFDVDYIFTQIRTKAVGETSTIVLPCHQCETQNEVSVNLDDIKVNTPKIDMTVKLTDEMSVSLKYPNYDYYLRNEKMLAEDTTATELALELMIACLDAVETEEERIAIADESREEVRAFIESLTTSQFEKLTEFMAAIPTLTHDVEFNCTDCATENKRTLKGLEDFF